MFLGCNLSAILPRSTFTKYHLLASQYPCEIKPVATPKSLDAQDAMQCAARGLVAVAGAGGAMLLTMVLWVVITF